MGRSTFRHGARDVPAWTPDDPWPSGTAGGASSPAWGGYVRLWTRAGLAPGKPFTMGAHANDRLDSGNVLGGAEIAPGGVPRAEPERLWVDLSCDVLDLEVAGGASSAQGIFSNADAATLVVTLADPTAKYDPLNRHGPYAYAGRSRLVPGTPVEMFAEVVNGDDGTWTRHYLFTGTADSWGEDWVPRATRRQAKLVATDVTKQWVAYNQPEQAAQGAGETTAERVQRFVTFFGWAGTVEPAPASTVTLQATTLAASGWELLNRTLDDELGYVYFTPEGNLRWLNRDVWFADTLPVLELGCDTLEEAGETFYDVLVDAAPSTLDRQMRNAVYAARSGGTAQAAISSSSQSRYGVYDYKRTDLGLETDPQAGEWAETVLVLYAYPQVALENVTLRPAIEPRSWEVWNPTLALALVSDLVRLKWAPPDIPANVIDATARVVGVKHRVTRRAWEVTWQLVAADALTFSGSIFTMGSHANDRLDAGFVLGFT
jgi:hypothetical protein